MGFALLGTVISAGSSLMSGIASSEAADYQAQIARNNAIVAQRNAQWTSQAGDIQATNAGLKSRAEIAQYKADIAGKGVDVNTGSAAAVQAGAVQNANTDTQTIRANAGEKAYGYLVQQQADLAQANAYDAQSSFDILGGILKSVGGLASGAGNFGSLGTSLASAASSISDTFAPAQVNAAGNLGMYLSSSEQSQFNYPSN